MIVLWATRGYSWGFKFLKPVHSEEDPLVMYERFFNGVETEELLTHQRMYTACRFPDPEGRKDQSGRLIKHDVVLSHPISSGPKSVEEVVAVCWPHMAARYAELYRQE